MIVVFAIFFLLVILGVPIAFAIGLTGMYGLYTAGGPSFLTVAPARLLAGVSDFILISIPLFVLCSELLNRSGMTDRIIEFSMSLVGRYRGGLSHVNVGASMLFSGLTGTAVTDTTAIGNILIPAMKKKGYGAGYSAAVTAATSVVGPIIPPSLVMIYYSSMFREVSVISMFAAGIVPGIIVVIFLFIASYLVSEKRKYPKERSYSFKEIIASFKNVILAIMTPVIILVAILSGFTTVTEAGGIAAFYALIIGLFVYRTLTWQDIYHSLIRTVIISGIVFFLIGAAYILGWVITFSGLPGLIAKNMMAITTNRFVQLAMVNVLFLITGMFLDIGPSVVLLAPIITPAMIQLGFDPLHFAMVMMVNVNIGNATPPMGMTLMVASQIARVPYEESIREVVPFLIAEIGALLLISYVPSISLWFPRLLGLSWG
jgi:tripartite ATP-independent transporter DctM subunit